MGNQMQKGMEHEMDTGEYWGEKGNNGKENGSYHNHDRIFCGRGQRILPGLGHPCRHFRLPVSIPVARQPQL